MFEVSESHLKAVNNEVEGFAGGRWAGVVRECVQGALNTRLTEKDTEIVSLYHRCVCLPVHLCYGLSLLACRLVSGIAQAILAAI